MVDNGGVKRSLRDWSFNRRHLPTDRPAERERATAMIQQPLELIASRLTH